MLLRKDFVTLCGRAPSSIEENLKEFLKHCCCTFGFCHNHHRVKGPHMPRISIIFLQVIASKETHSFLNSTIFTGISWSFSDAFCKACLVENPMSRCLSGTWICFSWGSSLVSWIGVLIFASSSLLIKHDSRPVRVL